MDRDEVCFDYETREYPARIPRPDGGGAGSGRAPGARYGAGATARFSFQNGMTP